MQIPSRHRRSRTFVGVFVLTLPVVMAACSSSSGSSSTTSSGGGSGSPSTGGGTSGGPVSCALASASIVNAALGTAVGTPKSDVNGSVTVCTYTSVNPPQSVIVRIDTSTNAAAFVASKSQFTTQGETITPVSGLGDQAFSSTLSGGSITTSTIVVLKGSASLLVTGSASLAQVEALATQLLPHI